MEAGAGEMRRRVPGGELDGVAAAPGERVDDEVAGRGSGGLRRRDGLRGGGVPALAVHAHAAVVQGEEAVAVRPVLPRHHGRVGGGIGVPRSIGLRRPDGPLLRLRRSR